MIVILVGPGSVGKTTILRELIRTSGWFPVAVYTTRHARQLDVGRVSLSKRQLEQRIVEEGELVTNRAFGNTYAITKAKYDAARQSHEIYAFDVAPSNWLPTRYPGARAFLILPADWPQLERQAHESGNASRIESIRAEYQLVISSLQRGGLFANLPLIRNLAGQVSIACDDIKRLL